MKTAVFSGGCFWCTEYDFEKVVGVIEVTSGYAGGHVDNPTYEQVCSETTGHRESVKVVYDSKIVSYEYLVDHLIRIINPTDATGSFNDKGESYTPAVFYMNDEEKEIAEKVIQLWNDKKIYRKPLAVKVLPYKNFFPAEEYHQKYHEKNPIRYRLYREGSGRDEQIKMNEELFSKGSV